MNNLEESLEILQEVAKSVSLDSVILQKSALESIDQLEKEYKLPAVYLEYLENYGGRDIVFEPTIIGQEIEIYSADIFEDGQDGYVEEGKGEIAIGNAVEFPFIIYDRENASNDRCSVYVPGSIKNDYKNRLFASSLSQFFLILSVIIELSHRKEFIEDGIINTKGEMVLRERLLEIDPEASKSLYWQDSQTG